MACEASTYTFSCDGSFFVYTETLTGDLAPYREERIILSTLLISEVGDGQTIEVRGLDYKTFEPLFISFSSQETYSNVSVPESSPVETMTLECGEVVTLSEAYKALRDALVSCSNSDGNVYEANQLGVDTSVGYLTVPETSLKNPSGQLPMSGETLEVELLVGGKQVVKVGYLLDGSTDIDLATDAPTTTTLNDSFVRPDEQTISFALDTGWQNHLTGATYTAATGVFTITEFDTPSFALANSVHKGVSDVGSTANALDKKIRVKIVSSAGLESVYDFIGPEYRNTQLYGYLMAMSFTGPDHGIGFASTGEYLYMGSIFRDPSNWHCLWGSNASTSGDFPAEGTLAHLDVGDQSIFPSTLSSDPNTSGYGGHGAFPQLLISANDNENISGQANNTKMVLLTPQGIGGGRGLNYPNTMAYWQVTDVPYDAGSPNPTYSCGFFGQDQSNGETNIWAQDTLGEFYLMEYNGSAWARTTPGGSPFTNQGTGTDLNKMVFDNVVEDLFLACWGTPSLNTIHSLDIWYYSGSGAKNDPSNWNTRLVTDAGAGGVNLAAAWVIGTSSNGFPDVRGIEVGSGDIYDFTFNGAAYVASAPSAQPMSLTNGVAFDVVKDSNDRRLILITGTFGDFVLEYGTAMFGEDGGYIESILKPSLKRPIATGERMMGLVY